MVGDGMTVRDRLVHDVIKGLLTQAQIARMASDGATCDHALASIITSVALHIPLA